MPSGLLFLRSFFFFVLENCGASPPALHILSSRALISRARISIFFSTFSRANIIGARFSALGAQHYYTCHTTSRTVCSSITMFPSLKLKPKLSVKKPPPPVEEEVQKPAAGLPYASILKRYCQNFICFPPPSPSPIASSS